MFKLKYGKAVSLELCGYGHTVHYIRKEETYSITVKSLAKVVVRSVTISEILMIIQSDI